MRLFALLLLALLASCSPANRRGYESPTGASYVLTVVSGDGQSGTAVIQPIIVSLSGTQPPAPAASVALSKPLVVLVTRNGQPVDGVVVLFSDPDPQHGVIGLGTNMTGQALQTSTFDFPATQGEAATSAQPYRIGTFQVNCQVDPQSGTSNIVTFKVTGT